MSSSRSLTGFIPTSWTQQQQQQQKKRTESILSSSSSSNNNTTVVHSPSWSNLSFDQLSLYARRASNSSLSMMATNNSSTEDKKRLRQKEKLLQTIQGFSQILLISLNDCSLGFYRISDHIHRKVPKIIETKKKLRKSSQKVSIAISDIKDVRKNVCDIERIESFYNINKMIEKSIALLNI